jgi:hypothetical protein
MLCQLMPGTMLERPYLDVVQTAQNLMLHLELCRHVELGSLLDLEWLVLERLLGARGREVDGNRVTALGVHGEREDNADTWVVWIRDGLATTTKSERFLVPAERLVILV